MFIVSRPERSQRGVTGGGPSVSKAITKYACRDAGNNIIGRDIFGDYRTRSDDGPLADGDSRLDDHACAKPCLGAYINGLTEHPLVLNRRLRVIAVVGVCEDHRLKPNECVVSEGKTAPGINVAIAWYSDPISKRQVFDAHDNDAVPNRAALADV
jgi:hypothetical protein